jgi:hypothetical protein
MSKLAEKLASAQKTGKAGAPKSTKAKPQAVAPAPAKRQRADWEAVERDYRTGKFSDGELAAKYSLSRESIVRARKRAQAIDPSTWAQDLGPQVRAATNALLMKEMVADKITEGHTEVTGVILVTAELNKQVILGHRSDIKMLRDMAIEMAGELQQIGRVDLKNMASMLESDDLTQDQIASLRDGVNAVTKLPSRILSVQRLAQTVTRVQALERQAFGLDDPETPPPVDEIGDLSDQDLDARISERLRVAGL